MGPPKGVGIITLRSFQRHEPILVDRGLSKTEFLRDDRSECDSLMPVEESRDERFALNAMACGSSEVLRPRTGVSNRTSV